MFEIVFLGTGSGIPSRDRNLASIWVSHEGENMLFDCGEGTQRQLMSARLNFMKIDRIFITHWHADHWAGLIGLIQTMNMERRKKELIIYAPEAERFVENILALGYWGPRFRIIPKNVPFEGDELTNVCSMERIEVFSIPARHSVPSVMYMVKEKDRVNVDIDKAEKLFGLKQSPLIGKLKSKGEVIFKGKKIILEDVAIVNKGKRIVYTGDTQYCSNLDIISRDADILIHDSTFESSEDTKMHSGAEDAARTAKRNNVKSLILTHFSRRYRDLTPIEKKAKSIFPNTKTARDFMKVKLK